jgi:hypothetical protein
VVVVPPSARAFAPGDPDPIRDAVELAVAMLDSAADAAAGRD